VLPSLGEQEFVTRVRGESDDLDLVSMREGDFERLASDRSCRAENGYA